MKNETGNGSRIITNDDVADKTRVGYCRVSTVEQNEARQLEAFKDLNLYRIYLEKASAKDTKRPLLQEMLSYVRPGDTVYVLDFSRLARSVKDLLSITEELAKKDVKLISLKESLDSSSATGRLMLTLIGAIHAFERENLLERQKEGIALNKHKFKGRKKVPRPSNWSEVYNQYLTRQITAKKAMELTGLKRNTFFNFLNESKSESKE
ncbi:Transposon Tn21 resolvase [Desulfitobacterium hafniense]|uniref:Transposon Tn21 resolvase n=1 Tax=Desulfitobacterium hafniense TaxID=49338 RepID=A0A098AY19_DESHA|nr:recombinase family protein [Desulfitobacterium hafniense]CDX01518.1 Transposon Tn21 resolvase [Desulfitobacterium hafniense]